MASRQPSVQGSTSRDVDRQVPAMTKQDTSTVYPRPPGPSIVLDRHDYQENTSYHDRHGYVSPDNKMKFVAHKRGSSVPVVTSAQHQLPMLHLQDTMRNHLTVMLGEFVGTFLFLFFAFAGTQVSNTPKPDEGALPNTANLLYGSLSFSFSLMVNVWAFYRVTGGMFNPAVTLALCVVGGMSPLRGVLVSIAQLLAGIVSAGVVSALFPGDLNVTTRLGGGTSISQGLFIEMFLTAQLVFIVIMLAVVKHKSTYLAPVGIGLAFLITQMTGDYYTGGSLNPARSLGPDVVNREFASYHYIYWLGPLMGSLLACGFFTLLRKFEYETANPGQDFNEWEAKMGSGSWDEAMGRPSSAGSMTLRPFSPRENGKSSVQHGEQAV